MGTGVEYGIRLKVDANGVVTGFLDANGAVKRFGDETQRQGERANTAFSKTRQGIESISGSLGRLEQLVKAGAAFGGLTLGAGALTKALFDAGAMQQRLTATFEFATGSAAKGREEFEFVRQTANRLGLELTSSAQAYSKLAAAAVGTSLAGDGVRQIFTAVSSAATVMGLSAVETQGALLSIGQMMSKGTVQAEEMRGQIGERLPAAFQTAARAMGVTTAEFGKMLESGSVLADQFLKKFAPELLKLVADALPQATKTATAQLNLMKNATTELLQAVAASGVLGAMSEGLRGMTWALNGVKSAADEAVGVLGFLATGAVIVGGLTAAGKAMEVLGTAAKSTAAGVTLLNAQLLQTKLLLTQSVSSIALSSATAAGGLIGLALFGGWEVGQIIKDIAWVRSSADAFFEWWNGKSENFAQRRRASLDVDIATLESQLGEKPDNPAPTMRRLAALRSERAGLDAYKARPSSSPGSAAADERAQSGAYTSLRAQLLGVDDQYEKNLRTLYAEYERSGDLGGYRKDVEALIGRQPYGKTLAAGSNKQQSEFDQYRKQALALGVDAQADAGRDPRLGAIDKLTKSEQLLAEIQERRLAGLLKMTPAQQADVEAVLRGHAAVEKANVARVEELKWRDELGKIIVEQLTEQERNTEAILDDAAAIEQQGRTVGMTQKKLLEYRIEQEKTNLAIRTGEGATIAETDALQRRIRGLEGLREAVVRDDAFGQAKQQYDDLFADLQSQIARVRAAAEADGGLPAALNAAAAEAQIRDGLIPRLKELQVEIAKAAGDNPERQRAVIGMKRDLERVANEVPAVWKKTMGTVDRIFADGFRSMLERGEGSWKAFTTSLANTFRTGLADVIYQFFARPFILQIVASVGGMLGMSGLASAATQAGGVGGGFGSVLGGASNLLSMFGGGGGGGIGGGIASLMGYGGATLAEVGSAVYGSATAFSSASLAAVAASEGLGVAAAGAGGMMSSLGAGLAAMGPVGWAALAAGVILGGQALFGGDEQDARVGRGSDLSFLHDAASNRFYVSENNYGAASVTTNPQWRTFLEQVNDPALFDRSKLMGMQGTLTGSFEGGSSALLAQIIAGVQGAAIPKTQNLGTTPEELARQEQQQALLKASIEQARNAILAAQDPIAYWTGEVRKMGGELGSQAMTVDQWRAGMMWQTTGFQGKMTEGDLLRWQAFGGAIEQLTKAQEAAARAAEQVAKAQADAQEATARAAEQVARAQVDARNAILAAQDPIDFWSKQVASMGSQLGSSAASVEAWQGQFLNALNATMSAEAMSKWQVFGTAIENLTNAQDAAARSAEQVAEAQTDAAEAAKHAAAVELASLRERDVAASRTLQSMTSSLAQDLGITTLQGALDASAVSQYRAPLDRLSAARGIFSSLRDRANAGDLDAVMGLPDVAQSYLSIGRDAYASGPDFQAIFQETNRALADVLAQQQGTQSSILATVPVTIQQAAQDQIGALKRGFAEVVAELQSVRTELRRLGAP